MIIVYMYFHTSMLTFRRERYGLSGLILKLPISKKSYVKTRNLSRFFKFDNNRRQKKNRGAMPRILSLRDYAPPLHPGRYGSLFAGVLAHPDHALKRKSRSGCLFVCLFWGYSQVFTLVINNASQSTWCRHLRGRSPNPSAKTKNL